MTVHTHFLKLHSQLSQAVIGQQVLVERLLVALLADGHLLVEGAPGLAKTRAIQSLAEHLDVAFQRIQFTPDLLPADLTGTEIYNAQTGEFTFRSGPVFSNFVLADEINRAPAKVQSALLEAMAEGQVTAGGQTRPLPEIFLVMATQNPLEQEGTYPLPEAQLDRFLLHTWVDYPNTEDELAIMRLVRHEKLANPSIALANPSTQPPFLQPPLLQLPQSTILEARQAVQQVHLAEPLERYIVDLVQATRQAARYDEQLGRYIRMGASPRACLALDSCSRALAWLKGRAEVLPEDIRELAPDVLRHRILLSYEADADGVRVDAVIQRLLALVAVA